MGCCRSKPLLVLNEIPINEQPVGESISILPGRLREKIWRLLDLKSKKALRSVCSEFKKEVDISSGLTVKVNDNSKGNLDFIQTVEVTNCSYIHLSDSFFNEKAFGKSPELFRCHWNLGKLQLWGKVSKVILQNLVLKCSDTLTAITFKPLALMTRTITLTPMESGHFEFPSLTTLIFHYGRFDTPTQDFKIFNENMKFILRTFSCPKLRELKVLPEEEVMKALYEDLRTIDHANVRWESSPVLRFIEQHRFTLRGLDICLYRSTFSKQERQFKPPRNLYEYSVVCPVLHEVVPEPYQENFWQMALGKQSKLFKFTAQVELWGSVEKLFTFLKSTVIYDNYILLHEISIVSYHRKTVTVEYETIEYEVDFSTFARCENLAILRVKILHLHNGPHSKQDDFIAVKLMDVPWGIIEIEISGVLCPSDDLVFLAHLPRLRTITLKDVGYYGAHGTTYEVARALFINKGLETIKLDGYNDTSDRRKLTAIIRRFNKGKFENCVEISNPSSQIKCLDWMPGCCFFRYGGFKLL